MSPSPASRHFSMRARTSSSIMASSVLSSSQSGIRWLPMSVSRCRASRTELAMPSLVGVAKASSSLLRMAVVKPPMIGMTAFQAIIALASSARGGQAPRNG